MKVNKTGWIILTGILGLWMIITIAAFMTPAADALAFSIRLFALWGFYFMLVATIITPFMKEIYQALGTPFLKVHHTFAALGIIFATLHPINFAIQQASLAVFVPVFSSWIRFWELAGRPALILIYISSSAAFFRKKIKNWRKVHALMYIVLLFVVVHGNLIGTDFGIAWLAWLFNILFGIAIVGMVYKHAQKRIQMKKRAQAKSKSE